MCYCSWSATLTLVFNIVFILIYVLFEVTCVNMLKKGALSGKIDDNMYGNISVRCGNMLHKDIRRH